jgi:hypothetical protein
VAVTSATLTLAFASGQIEVGNVKTGSVSTIHTEHSELRCFGATPEGTRVVTGDVNGSVAVWDLKVPTEQPKPPLPDGRARVELAYFATLDNPQIYEVLETFDESVLTAVLAQAGGSAADALATLKSRHSGDPPPLWSAWAEWSLARRGPAKT